MKTCKDIRRENARSLATEGPAEFAKRVSDASGVHMAPQQANQLIGPSADDPEKGRGIGDEIARRIERAYDKEEGWLDHEQSSKTSNSEANRLLSDEAKNLILWIERLDALGDLARKTFAYHQGLLLLSSAATELQTGSARAQMLAELQHLLGPPSEPSGGINERKPKKQGDR